MAKENLLMHRVTVTKQGQYCFFQIPVPRDADRISEIETGVRFLVHANNGIWRIMPSEIVNGFNYDTVFIQPQYHYRVPVVGELRLQTCDDTNIFYSCPVRDAGLKAWFDVDGKLLEVPWTHGQKKETDELNIHGQNPVLLGYFKDVVGEEFRVDFHYEVSINLTYKTIKK